MIVQSKATARSLYVFAGHVVAIVTVLLAAPRIILPLFGLPTDGEVWLRLLGFVLLCSSVYYIRAAKLRFVPFAKWTVYTRVAAPVVVAILILTGIAQWHMVSFGIVDGLGGLWTWLTLKQDAINDQ